MFFFCLLCISLVNANSVIPSVFRNRNLRSINQHGHGELIFAHAIWRHGDRMPDREMPKFGVKWPLPTGEMSLLGMEEQFKLGEKLRTRYMDTEKLISPYFNTEEIYVRSTDKNRTLQSASITMMGMYSQKVRKGTDVPAYSPWPAGFVAIPVHTVEYSTDYVANVNRKCPRLRKLLQTIYYKTPEGRNISMDPENKILFQYLSEQSGKSIDMFNFWSINDYAMVSRFHNVSLTITEDSLFEQIQRIDDKIDRLQFGLGLEPFRGVDLKLDMAKVRGSPMLFEIMERMNNKVFCRETEKEKMSEEQKEMCKRMDKLKFYAYSAHDMTISALFAIFGFPAPNVDEIGLPCYSTAVTIELRLIKNKYVVRLLFWPANKDKFQDITNHIKGCEGECTLKQFNERAEIYRVEDIKELCNTPLFPNSTDSKDLNDTRMKIVSSGDLQSYSILVMISAFILNSFAL